MNHLEYLKALSKNELKQKYFDTFNQDAPGGYSKSYLIKSITWQKQYGGLPKTLQNKIDQLIEQYSKTKTVDSKKLKQFEVTIGTKFIREFKGEKYEVVAVDKGFEYKNKIYKSLSTIANVITGTHWNGKKFFGVA